MRPVSAAWVTSPAPAPGGAQGPGRQAAQAGRGRAARAAARDPRWRAEGARDRARAALRAARAGGLSRPRAHRGRGSGVPDRGPGGGRLYRDPAPRYHDPAGPLATLAAQARAFAAAAKAANTVRAYAADWNDFRAWCEARQLAAISAAPETVALYLTDRAATLKTSSLARRLTTISRSHEAAGHPSPATMHHAVVSEVWRASAAPRAPPEERKKQTGRQKEASDLRTARTYCVFGYRDILERRKAAGLEWVVRGRGVEFVHADTGHPLFRDEDLIIGRVTPGDAIASGESPGLTAGEAPDATASDPPAITAGPVGRDTGKASEETSSSVAAVLRVLSRFGVADDDVAAKLISACRAHAVDCTPEEIVHFIERKGSLTKESHNSRIHRPIGFLLTAVPKCFVSITR